MRVRWSLGLFYAVMAMVALQMTSCASGEAYSMLNSSVSRSIPTVTGSSQSSSSLAANASSFSFSSGSHSLSPRYTIHASAPLSKLRHGHEEFTINLASAGQSLIIAFIGYTGPATYTLSNRVNGGDVRITLGQRYWDLSLVPTASCSLVVLSDVPTEQIALHRMQGRFSCPLLPAGETGQSPRAVTISDGVFDVLIVVES